MEFVAPTIYAFLVNLFVCLFDILGKIETSVISLIILFKHYCNSSCLSAVV